MGWGPWYGVQADGLGFKVLHDVKEIQNTNPVMEFRKMGWGLEFSMM